MMESAVAVHMNGPVLVLYARRKCQCVGSAREPCERSRGESRASAVRGLRACGWPRWRALSRGDTNEGYAEKDAQNAGHG